MIEFDRSKLKGAIVQAGYETRKSFADAMGWSYGTCNNKLNGDSSWTDEEIFTAAALLRIPFERIPFYFLAVKVANLQQN